MMMTTAIRYDRTNYTIAKFQWNKLSERPNEEIESTDGADVVLSRLEVNFECEPQLANYILMAEAAASNL